MKDKIFGVLQRRKAIQIVYGPRVSVIKSEVETISEVIEEHKPIIETIVSPMKCDLLVEFDMESYTKEIIPRSYEVAQHIIKRIEGALGKPVPKVETGYLAVHIERILN